MINRYLTLTLILLLCACSAFPKETNSMKRVYIEEGADRGIKVDVEEGVDGDTELDVEEGVNEVGDEGEE